jgi:hypothetical protein
MNVDFTLDNARGSRNTRKAWRAFALPSGFLEP